ncbi:reverse transcriptase domain-containing protein [Tanacetum coccineum]
MKQNRVTDDALRLYLFPYSLTHHATAWFDRLPKNSIHTFQEMAMKFLSKYFPLSMVTKLRNEISNFRQLLDESLFEAWEHYKLSIDRFNYATPSCKTYGGAHSYYECQATGGYTQDVYATTGNYNPGGNAYQPQGDPGPSVLLPPLSFSSKEVERDPKTITNQIPPSPASTSSELLKWNPHQPLIPYPSRLNKEKLQDKSDIQAHKFLQMFKKPHFNISLVEALALMPKYGKMLKDLLSDKKLLGLANTSFTKNWLAVLLKKLPEKLGDPRKFLIPCDFLELEKCMALADLAGIAEDVCVQVGKFTFPTDFVVIDYDVDPRVPLILGRPFLRTARALVDVYREELILRDGDEKLIFHADNTLKHPQKHGNDGSTTSPSDSSPSLTPFETSDSLLEEFANELALLDQFPLGNKDYNFDPEADLREIEYLLNQDPSTDSLRTTDIDIIDPILERFTDEPALVYSSPPGDDDDDLFDLKSDNKEWKKLLYGDHFNDIHSGKDTIKDSKINILIDELESPESNVLLPQLLDSDSTLPEESSKSSEIATLLSSPFGNEDKVFIPGILILGGTHIFHDESKDKDLKVNSSSEAFFLEERNFLSISSD